VLLMLLAGVRPAPAADERLLDGGADRVLRRAFLPSASNVHGELRIVRRGDAACVQTLLYSKALRRGLQAIQRKELAQWPPGMPGQADSATYLAALSRARTIVLQRFDAQPAADRRQKMLIEFVLSGSTGLFALYAVELSGEGADVHIERKEPLEVHEASAAYLARAMRGMAESAFHEAVPELEQLLERRP
jgi:hypothetical protein